MKIDPKDFPPNKKYIDNNLKRGIPNSIFVGEITGAELKRLRLKLGLTQTQLADEIGAHFPRISSWENGKCKISKSYQRILKEYFKQ